MELKSVYSIMHIYILEISASLSNDKALFSCHLVFPGRYSLLANLNKREDMSDIMVFCAGSTYKNREPSGPLFL
jgi:hypothetical protein